MRNKKIINDRQYRYAIRKLNVGVVSVAVSALMFLGGPVALADQNAADTTAGETEIVDTAPEAQAPLATTSVTSTQENESPTIDNEVAQLAENSATATASEASADEVFSSEAISEIPADNAISSVATSSESLNYSETATNEANAITEEAPVAEPTPQADDTAVNETLAGYTTSAPETTATIVDPVKGHYTLEVIQDNDTGVTYVFSIDETVNEADLVADDGARNVYMTRFKNGNVISTDTIDRSAAKGTSLTYDDTEIVILSENDLQLGTTKTGTYRVLYNAISTPSGQDVSTINICESSRWFYGTR
ncbi:YSIRK-type signal peptide-containing protein [Ligilactobacillus apodemi]|uniref:YSIRK Gram-positive signal peptide domain-containing protein n=1 Tax=Ligilactobacillus apodemi DSM 16634 = JCM 16172 TaxID=1423724 RepID=A0A0R1TTA3_9LACO|nr:YSIRK-type signal peptide-containing protein [Ligilactobacillus apodemi]KRL84521.1 hypothetical protein FC32_GL000541 [Ligilactobacillus apodemi DSM 16634 = JCM 16172]